MTPNEKMIRYARMCEREQIEERLSRLDLYKRRGVQTWDDAVEERRLKRRLADIEFEQEQKP